MGILHLVNRSPFKSSGLLQCLERTGAGDVVLLLESGVYAALKDSAFAPRLGKALSRVSVQALTPDLSARGVVADEILPGVVLVDYEGFVELSLLYSPIQSWF